MKMFSVDARRLAKGCNSRILVSLRVFKTKRHCLLAVRASFRVHPKK